MKSCWCVRALEQPHTALCVTRGGHNTCGGDHLDAENEIAPGALEWKDEEKRKAWVKEFIGSRVVGAMWKCKRHPLILYDELGRYQVDLYEAITHCHEYHDKNGEGRRARCTRCIWGRNEVIKSFLMCEDTMLANYHDSLPCLMTFSMQLSYLSLALARVLPQVHLCRDWWNCW